MNRVETHLAPVASLESRRRRISAVKNLSLPSPPCQHQSFYVNSSAFLQRTHLSASAAARVVPCVHLCTCTGHLFVTLPLGAAPRTYTSGRIRWTNKSLKAECSWEGNRRSGAAQTSVVYPSTGSRKFWNSICHAVKRLATKMLFCWKRLFGFRKVVWRYFKSVDNFVNARATFLQLCAKYC